MPSIAKRNLFALLNISSIFLEIPETTVSIVFGVCGVEWFDALMALSDWEHWPDFVLNASTELLGIIVTVLIVTPLVGSAVRGAQRRRQADRERRLIRVLKERHKAIARAAGHYANLVERVGPFLSAAPLDDAIDDAILARDGQKRITGHDARGRPVVMYKGDREIAQVIGSLPASSTAEITRQLRNLADQARYAVSDSTRYHIEMVRLVEQLEVTIGLMNVDLSERVVHQVADYLDALHAINVDWSAARHTATHLLRLIDQEEVDLVAVHGDAVTREDTYPEKIGGLVEAPSNILSSLR